MSIVRRVIPLTVGWEHLPKSYSVHGDDSGAMLVEPVPAIALDTDDTFPQQHGMFRIAFDAAHLTENIEREVGPGGFVHCAAADALKPILRLKAIAAERGLPLVPGHDPEAWPALTAELASA